MCLRSKGYCEFEFLNENAENWRVPVRALIEATAGICLRLHPDVGTQGSSQCECSQRREFGWWVGTVAGLQPTPSDIK